MPILHDGDGNVVRIIDPAYVKETNDARMSLTFKSGGIEIECEVTCPPERAKEMQARLEALTDGLG